MTSTKYECDTYRGEKNRRSYIRGCVFMVFLCTIVFLHYTYREMAFADRGVQTIGIGKITSAHVEGAKWSLTSCGRYTYPCMVGTIEFTDTTGRNWTIAYPAVTNMMYQYAIASENTVWYLSDSPGTNFHGSMALDKRSWFIARLLMISGALIFAALAGWFYFVCDDRDFMPNPHFE